MAGHSLEKNKGREIGVSVEEGRTVGHYRLIRQIGHGGMGTVYEATDEGNGNKVALKFMSEHLLRDDTDRKRFEREMIIAAKLDHPGITSLIDFGEDDGRPYYVTEYVEGWPLNLIPREALLGTSDQKPTRTGPDVANGCLSANSRSEVEELRHLVARFGEDVSSPEKPGQGSRKAYFSFVAGLALQAAEALEHAHQQGVIHRDIKPSNLILTRDGKVKILDFGLGKMEDLETVTATGDFFGTPAYMSPEQAAGEASEVDQRSDIYSLGMTLYQLLTATTAFTGNTRTVTSAILHKEPVEPRQLDKEIPRGLNAVVLKTIEKRREDRYQSATEFADDLRRYLSGKTIRARRGHTSLRLTIGLRRKKKITIIVSSCLLLVAASIIGITEYLSKKREQDRSVRLGELRRYEKLIEMASDARGRGLFYKAIPYLKKAILLRNTAEARLRLWNAKRLNRLLCVLGRDGGDAGAVAIGPAGRLLASGHADRSVRVSEMASRREKWRATEHRNTVTALCFSPDGRLLASGDRQGDVYLWDVEEGKSVAFSGGNGAAISAMAFLRSGSQVWISGSDGAMTVLDSWKEPEPRRRPYQQGDKFLGCAVRAYPKAGFFLVAAKDWAGTVDMTSLDPLFSISYEESVPSSVAASVDGDRLALAYPYGKIVIHSKSDPSPRTLQQAGEGQVASLTFLEEGRRLLTCDLSGAMAIWDVDAENRLETIANECRGVRSLAVSPNGEMVALAAVGGGVQIWRTDVKEVEPEVTLLSPDGEASLGEEASAVTALSISAKGTFVAAGNSNGKVAIWRVGTAELERSFKHPHFCVTSLAFSSRDESLMAYATEEGNVRLCDISTGKVIHEFALEESAAQCLAFSPDGLMLAAGDRSSGIHIYGLTSSRVKRRILLEKVSRHVVTDLLFPPSKPDMLVCWTSDGHARFLNVRTGEAVRDYAPEGVSRTRAAIGPRGNRVAIVTQGGNVGLWDVRRETPVEFEKEGIDSQAPTCLVFSPDGEIIASVSQDMAVRLWDARQGREAVSLNLLGQPTCLAFDRSSSRLAVGLTDGRVVLYDFSSP